MQPELLITKWVMSDPISSNVGCAQYHFIIRWEWYVRDQAQAGPGDIRNCIRKWPRFLRNPLLLHRLSSLNVHLWPHGGVFRISWLRKENIGLGLQIFLPKMLAEVEVVCLQHYSPTQVWPRRTVLKRTSLNGQNSVPGWLICLEGKNDRGMDLY